MTDPYAVKWTDGTSRVRWGVKLSDGRQLRRGYYNTLYFGSGDIGTASVARFRTQRQAWRVGRRYIRREARRSWTEDD